MEVLGERWTQAAAAGGIVLVDMCGGMGAVLEAALMAGVKVSRYIYLDTDSEVRLIMAVRLQQFLQRFPDQLPADAISHAMEEPRDVRQVTQADISRWMEQAAASHSAVLMSAGWPCQDLSAAGEGQGLRGARSGLIFFVHDIIVSAQMQAKALPEPISVGYLLENVACQLNHSSVSVRERDFGQLVAMLGQPVCFDAAAAGSLAHRMRNYWSNLWDFQNMQHIMDALHQLPRTSADPAVGSVLDLDHDIPYSVQDDRLPFFQCNKRGEPLQAWPTLMAMQGSRAFRPGRQGSLRNRRTGDWEEPSVEERELAMGFQRGTTAAPGASSRARHAALGNTIDLNALNALFQAGKLLAQLYISDHCLRSAAMAATTLAPLTGRTAAVLRYGAVAVGILEQQGYRTNRAIGLRPGGLITPVRLSVQAEDIEGAETTAITGAGLGYSGESPAMASDKPWFVAAGTLAPTTDCAEISPPFAARASQQRRWTLQEVLHEVAWYEDSLAGQETACSYATMSAPSLVSGEQSISLTFVTLQLVSDRGGRRCDPWEDINLLAHLRGQPVHQVAADIRERRRILSRAPAYRMHEEDKLLRVLLDGSTRIVPPIEERRELVRKVHVGSAHFSATRMMSLLLRTYYWPRMRSDVDAVLGVCVECKRRQTAFTADDPELHPLPILGLCYRWSVDLCKLPKTSWGFERVMICVEHLSRYLILIPLLDKSARETAFAFLLHVVGIFGVCAELITDNGTEFRGEFAELLTKLGIDHRTTSAHRAQSNGLAERAVQTVKKGVAKLTMGGPEIAEAWEWELSYLQSAYNSSVQSSTKCCPSMVMMAQAPVVPPAAKERFDKPLELFELDADQQLVAADLVKRADLLKRLGFQATQNLQVAQHRDTLRYAQTHTGQYVKPKFKFEVGDFVYVYKQPKVSTDVSTHPNILRIEGLSDRGIAELCGADGNQCKRHVRALAPCHLTDLEVEDYQANEEHWAEAIACEVCGSSERDDLLLLCDQCTKGWHIDCLVPPLDDIPAGDWFCQPCLHEAGYEDLAEAQVIPAAPARRRRQRCGSCGPCLHPHWHKACIGEPAAEHEVRLTTSAVTTTPDEAPAHLVAPALEGTMSPCLPVKLCPAHRLANRRAWSPHTRDRLRQMLSTLMPGAWDRKPGFTALLRAVVDNRQAIIKLQQEGADQLRCYPAPASGEETLAQVVERSRDSAQRIGLTTVVTRPEEVHILLEHVRLQPEQAGVAWDPWSGTGTIAAVMARAGIPVLTNDANPLSPAMLHMDALSSDTYQQWRQSCGLGAIVCSPHFALLDLALPLAAQFVEQVACIHVPGTYYTEANEIRSGYLAKLQAAGRLARISFLPRGPRGYRCMWICIFRSAAVRRRLLIKELDA